MVVSDVMSTNVVSIPSHTSVAEARRILDAHRFRRLPVVDRGKLVGIVSKDALDKMGPSQLTTFSIHEISYLLSKITVKEIMHRDVVTIAPDMTIEQAVALAQIKGVGSLMVIDGERVVGILTTNDIFYRVLNPILGIAEPGSRIVVRDCYQGPDVEKVIAAINKLGVGIVTLFTIALPEVNKHDLVVHLETEDASRVIQEVKGLGCLVEERAR
jgi:acetoin utilization protein AcuB